MCNQKVSSFKCETDWEAFMQGTIRGLEHRNKEAKNVKHKGSRFIGKRFLLVWNRLIKTFLWRNRPSNYQ